MPLTELVLVVSGFAACALVFVAWLGLDRSALAAGGAVAPRWLRVARHPATAVATALPVLLALGLLAARASLLQAG